VHQEGLDQVEDSEPKQKAVTKYKGQRKGRSPCTNQGVLPKKGEVEDLKQTASREVKKKGWKRWNLAGGIKARFRRGRVGDRGLTSSKVQEKKK